MEIYKRAVGVPPLQKKWREKKRENEQDGFLKY